MEPIRRPIVAGRFYPDDKAECVRMLDSYKRAPRLGKHIFGAVSPHAGWIYSGQPAALAISALSNESPETVVVFGAMHTRDTHSASAYAEGAWETPLGLAIVDSKLGKEVLNRGIAADNVAGHSSEHSIEVLIPIIQYYLGGVQVLPISVKPGLNAAEIGLKTAIAVQKLGRKAVFLASTDLTHYGPHFGFEPQGRGEAGVRWAKDVNDRRFIDLIKRLEPEAAVQESSEHHNACGAGAVAAGIAACVQMGAVQYVELSHTCSADSELTAGGGVSTSVGYEAGIFTD